MNASTVASNKKVNALEYFIEVGLEEGYYNQERMDAINDQEKTLRNAITSRDIGLTKEIVEKFHNSASQFYLDSNFSVELVEAVQDCKYWMEKPWFHSN